ncbi:uncharacterized protein LOC115623126 [Scaptodrosophila lebanonensis]|uniref:Uncharacterized protein LOC115623126 n=1 Tax=Drosophila lebanonensis TaxID=7225 RepID=A0A6J2TAY2_DROLE|nr:uncharacterized protein LOC115623126 [Scaptodrosophila lebanonensis]
MPGSASTNADPCKRKSSPMQNVVAHACDSVSEIITKYRRKICCEARQVVRNAKCRECGSLVRRSNFTYAIQGKRFSVRLGSEEMYVGILMAVIGLMLLTMLYLVRRYNHTFAYGTGGCVSTVLWTYDDCNIVT